MKDQNKIRQQQAMMQSDNLEIEGWEMQGDQYTMHTSPYKVTLSSTPTDIDTNDLDNSFTLQGSFAEDYNWTTEKSDMEIISDRLKTVEDRLAILVPDPEKLKKWEALQEAYDHYKSLEALIGNPKEGDEEEK